MTTTSSDIYRVTVWNKEDNDPYYVLDYESEDTAKFVARNMRRHYVEEFVAYEHTPYEVRLQKIQGGNDG